MAHSELLFKSMDKIKEQLEQFEKRDLALRKALAKRQELLNSRQKTLRVVEQTISVAPNPRWRGQSPPAVRTA